MKAGQLRHRVTLQKAAQVPNAIGAVETTWKTDRVLWAKVSRLAGRELFAAQQVAPEIRTSVTLRYLAGVTSKMRILHDGQTMNIKSVLPDERKRELVLMCEEPL